MLVLSCRKQDKICIGQDIVLTITDLTPGKVRVGIEAPDELKILRVPKDKPGRDKPQDALRPND